MNAGEVLTVPVMNDVATLLDAAGLPRADIDEAMLANFVAVRRNGRVAGIAGLEPHGRDGLLRSLVVRDPHRRTGLGRVLVDEVERRAAAHGVRTLYLLTSTAADYFRGLGYCDCPRVEAPVAIRETGEFSTLCPEDASFMCTRL